MNPDILTNPISVSLLIFLQEPAFKDTQNNFDKNTRQMHYIIISLRTKAFLRRQWNNVAGR